jgi:hypothetical protein
MRQARQGNASYVQQNQHQGNIRRRLVHLFDEQLLMSFVFAACVGHGRSLDFADHSCKRPFAAIRRQISHASYRCDGHHKQQREDGT